MPKGKLRKQYKFKNPELQLESAKDLKPSAKGSIPKLAVLLGLLSPLYYDIYERCNGKKTISAISEEMKIDLQKMLVHVDQLQKNGLISL